MTIEATTPYRTPKEAAAYLRVTVDTVAKWRSNGKGPKFTKTPTGMVLYRVADLDAFVNGGDGA